MKKEKSAAIITIHDAPSMSKRGRTAIAKWMRRQADFLEKEAANLSHRFTARYLYTALLLVAVLSLTGCKTLDQVRQTAHDLIDIAGKTYEDGANTIKSIKDVLSPEKTDVPKDANAAP